MRKTISKFVAGLFCFAVVAFTQEIAPLFSPFNQYELSYEAHQYVRESFDDSMPSPWFSHSPVILRPHYPLQLSAGEQRLGLDAGTILGYERCSSSNRFAALSGQAAYASSFLNAFVSVDVYTTESRLESPVNDIRYERFIRKGAQEPITGVFDFRFNLPEAYIASHWKFITLSIGKQKLRWGPGYKGTLGLSGTTFSPFYYYNLQLEFGHLLHMAAFLCGYDDESTYRNELQIIETMTVKSNDLNLKSFFPRYGAGQRLEMRLGNHLQISLYELVDFFGSNELNRFANPLQIYYLANEASGTNNANLLGGMDFNLVFNRFRLYGEFLNDDITVMEQAGNPDKYAFQLGCAYYGTEMLVQTGMEYTHVARYVYGHSRVLSRHAHWGEPMGWPWGNYQDVFTAYAVCRFPYNINGKIEANLWIEGDGAIEDDWYADGKPDLDHAPYWPENSTTIFSAILSAQYSPFSWLTYCFYWEPIIREGTVQNGFYTYLMLELPGKHLFDFK
ncbi:MAG: hypothetical protein JXA18_05570 [Chitinispirillaceae bacterium]|nr:hypothetical protein [Chitinispirillaceae bacterium]